MPPVPKVKTDFSALAERLSPLDACFPADGFCFEVVILLAGDAESTTAWAATSTRPSKSFSESEGDGARSPHFQAAYTELEVDYNWRTCDLQRGSGATCSSRVAFPTPCVAFSSGDFATFLPGQSGHCAYHFTRISDFLFETD